MSIAVVFDLYVYAIKIVGLIFLGLLQDFKNSTSQDSAELSLILSNYHKLKSYLEQKISKFDNVKILLGSQLANHQKQLQE